MDSPAHRQRLAVIHEMRRVLKDKLEAGLVPGGKAICHGCGNLRPLSEIVEYGQYRLCFNCTLRYEKSSEHGEVGSIEDFILSD